jgi:hypothetical protein
MRTLEIIKNDEILSSAFEYILLNSTSLTMPYHHLHHNLIVFKSCYDILNEQYLNDTEIYKKELLVASLFHDFNHSGGKLTDDKNIKNAIAGFSTWHTLSEFSDSVDYFVVVNILKATQYPYIDIDKMQVEYLIIRDADLTPLFYDTVLQFNLMGLSTEMNATLKNTISGSIKFVNNIYFNFPFFENQWKEIKPKILEEYEYLLNILS